MIRGSVVGKGRDLRWVEGMEITGDTAGPSFTKDSMSLYSHLSWSRGDQVSMDLETVHCIHATNMSFLIFRLEETGHLDNPMGIWLEGQAVLNQGWKRQGWSCSWVMGCPQDKMSCRREDMGRDHCRLPVSVLVIVAFVSPHSLTLCLSRCYRPVVKSE
jgi:hypothetical protein